jgi:ubiquinol-cytochrome c reductase cytochrome b subunit
MFGFYNWLDERLGVRRGCDKFFSASVAGRPCFCRSLPSALVFAFLFQVITGFFIFMYYSASAQTAWESVYFLQYEIPAGWLLRAAHHYCAQLTLVLIGVYMVGLIVRGACKAPREFVFWSVLGLGLVTLGLLLTGDLLAWDQNSQSATAVRTNFLLLIPYLGGYLNKLAIGGPAYGSLTLTRFLALHIFVLAGSFGGLLALLLWSNHRAREVEKLEAPATSYYWPCQVLANGVVCIGVLVVVFALALSHGVTGDLRGVVLGAPANPTDFYAAARPEWAFMGLYGFSNLFPGNLKFLPIFVIPTSVILLYAIMPFTGRFKVGYLFNLGLTIFLLVGNFWLTYQLYAHDRVNEEYLAAVAEGDRQAERVVQLIRGNGGIPVEGAISLLQSDPKTQGPKLFKKHCSSCHDFSGGTDADIKAEDVSAPNLFGYGTRKWVAGWFDAKSIAGDDYFGKTKFRKEQMVEFLEEAYTDLDDDEKTDVESMVIALSAQANLKSQAAQDKADKDRIEEGNEMLVDECTDCHKVGDDGDLGDGPDLTGYGSREWTIGIIANPAHKRFYGKSNDRMPAYAATDDDSKNLITRAELEMLADWLRGDWYEPVEVVEKEAIEKETEKKVD